MEEITVEVKMFMKAKKSLPVDFSDGRASITLEQGSTLQDLKKRLGIPVETFKGIVIDGTNNEIEDSRILKDGDTLSIFATVAGG